MSNEAARAAPSSPSAVGASLVCGAILLAVMGIALRGGDASAIPLAIDAYLVFIALAFVAYGFLVPLVLGGRLAPSTLQYLMMVALLMRVVALIGPARYNSDVWRYLWDGHVLAHGFNPYAYVPAAEALDGIRDPAIYANLNPAYNGIGTVYGPLAMVVFALVDWLPGHGPWTMRLVMTLGDVAAIVLLIKLLRACKLPEGLALIYALNPLTIDSFAQRGQVDGILVPLLVAVALLMTQKRWALAGMALVAAASVKVVALACVPALLFMAWRVSPRAFRRGLAAMVIGGAGVSAFYVHAGRSSLQGLLTFSEHWRTNASLFPLIEWVGGAIAAMIVAGVMVIVAIVVSARQPSGPAQAVTVVALPLGALLLWAPAVFPWYVTWLLPFAPILLAAPQHRWAGAAIISASGAVFLWYLRFLVYTPMDTAASPRLSEALQWWSRAVAEPWRVVEYGAVIAVVVLLSIRRKHRMPQLKSHQ